MPQNGRVYEVVVKDGIGAGEQLRAAQREQARLTRPRPYEINFTSHPLKNNSMTAPSPASWPLIPPDLRHKLQQNHEQALRLSAARSPDATRIYELLAECVRSDPGNMLYLGAFLTHVRPVSPSWFSRAVRWLEWMKPGGAKIAAANDGDDVVLRGAPEILARHPRKHGDLARLAQAAAAYELDQAELRYWELAVEAAPGDAEIVRGFVQALTWQGHFTQAVEAWRKLLAVLPGDETALQAIAALSPAVDSSQNDFASAEQALDDEQAAGAPLLAMMARREEFQISRSQHRLTIAERLAANDEHPRAQTLARRLYAEHQHVVAEILHLRAERLPQDWQTRLALARALKRSGNFSGAISRLEEAARLREHDPEILIELGECWQHLRQFAKALEFFRQAIGAAELPEQAIRTEILQIARYRAAVLAEALGQSGEARALYRALMDSDAGHKEARQRLDKLESN